ncbi:PepSY domain-containing protein [Aliihoeflea aestuarii]|uniref:PepSY domain-containing protein n=1 Tax=Aliihoeflea aestuarii TaxID=453840 RepID=UPI0020950288|nr:PepSY domain-containing protein [Aliihoeflea aestuarii]
MKSLIAAAFLSAAFAVPAFAQPPAGSMPLSEILANIEAEAGFGYFDEIDWDDDGYWEIEYYRADGAKVEIDIDPASGQARR